MKLLIQRSQRTTGLRGTPIFTIRARAEIVPEEKQLISHYGFGKEVVYVSAQAQQHAAAAASSHARGSVMRTWGHAIASRMSLTITVNDLAEGKTVEAKSLEEVVGVEEAMKSACENLKGYLELAKTFDGRTEVIEF